MGGGGREGGRERREGMIGVLYCGSQTSCCHFIPR